MEDDEHNWPIYHVAMRPFWGAWYYLQLIQKISIAPRGQAFHRACIIIQYQCYWSTQKHWYEEHEQQRRREQQDKKWEQLELFISGFKEIYMIDGTI